MSTLHIYAQEIWHDEAYIAGTRESLEMLRDTINGALAEGCGQMQDFTCDGEGYWVRVALLSGGDAEAMPVPYTDDIAQDKQARIKFGPWMLKCWAGK